ncbi:hypothetical protein NE237_008071 [Protea cynaroides]|uniref:Uncharacterized protein n=1 Tax=Protea cynaroides TaxID=273540 RepID=A0A9Q0KQL5_9MAGN|nr:hypothetical protein NE237_008071 [Protea cynaroides]
MGLSFAICECMTVWLDQNQRANRAYQQFHPSKATIVDLFNIYSGSTDVFTCLRDSSTNEKVLGKLSDLDLIGKIGGFEAFSPLSKTMHWELKLLVEALRLEIENSERGGTPRAAAETSVESSVTSVLPSIKPTIEPCRKPRKTYLWMFLLGCLES